MNRKSDNRLERLMIELGLPKFLYDIIEVLDRYGDDDAKLRRLKHQMNISLRDYRESDVDNDDGA